MRVLMIWLGILLTAFAGCGGGGSGEAIKGKGKGFGEPISLNFEADGQVVVVDQMAGGHFGGAVFRVDPVSGDRTVISSDVIGSGPAFNIPSDIAVEANGQLVVVDTNHRIDWEERILRVDPLTGDRTVVSGYGIGSGPDFELPQTIAVEDDGHLLVADSWLQVVLRVDPVSGDRTVVTGCPGARLFKSSPRSCLDDLIGSGPLLGVINYIVFIALGADGHLLISGWDLSVLRVDPVSGDRTIVTGCTNVLDGKSADYEPECIGEIIGNGPLPGPIGPIAVQADGGLVVGVGQGGGLLRIDPVTGDRSILSDDDIGSGPPLPRFPTCIVVEPDGNFILTGNSVRENGQMLHGIMRVDAVTGDRTLVSGSLPDASKSDIEDPSPASEDDSSDDGASSESGFK